jgi:hypothetical protein
MQDKSLHTQSPLTKVACHNAHVMHVIHPCSLLVLLALSCFIGHEREREREKEREERRGEGGRERLPVDMVR